MMRRTRHPRRGMEAIISTIILTSIVLVIGASVWGLTHSASSIIAGDYYDEVMDSVGNIKERLYIENIRLDTSGSPPSLTQNITIWVANYGKITINITSFTIKRGSTAFVPSSSQLWCQGGNKTILPGEIKWFTIYINPSKISFEYGGSLYIEVRTGRENKAYATILAQES